MPDRNGKIFYTSITSLSHISKQIGDVTAGAQITEASTDSGDWYPSFSPDLYSYSIVVPNGTASLELKYKAAENAEVKLGSTVQQADESGYYTLSLKTSAQTVNVTSQNGVTNTYSFKIQPKSKYDVPDKVVDYLCINSQYTNAGFGVQPETTLSGSLKSLGNFGGYITYYYENGLVDNPNNKYGIDFYVYGNANKDTSTSTKTSFFEPGQIWVSEDGNSWYALAGSAHYDDGVDWNYTVKYSKLDTGKTEWTDSKGNSNGGKAYTGNYPLADKYYLNSLVNSDTITLSGIALPARSGDIALSGQATDAYPVKWGYADCFANGTFGTDVNPYTDNSNYDLQTNGFDLQWAVDADGNPINVSGKVFHYIKVQTASNIWHPSFAEKSTEVTSIIRTTAQPEAVGETDMPEGVTIFDGSTSKHIIFNQGQQVYEADLGDMKYVSISVNGASDDANVYVNNERIAAGGSAEGIKVTKEIGKKFVRVIVQEGEKEPHIILLKLTSSAKESNELIEGVKINVSGSGRNASTKDGKVYTATVGHKIEKIGIVPVIESSVAYTINGMTAETEYELTYGENVFEITASDGNGNNQAISLKITREDAPPVSENKIQVYFVLYGDELHGDNGKLHTYQKDRSSLKIWASNRAYEVPEGSTVLDVFEKAMKANNLTYVNSGGNYISSINGLSEFSNGPLSGWMYLLNGSHPSSGVAEQIVKNGDRIVFHYTDDYTKEEGSEAWSKPFETEQEVTTSGTAGSAITTTPTEVAVSGDTAKATIKTENATEAIKQAKENKSAEIVIEVASADIKTAEKVQIEIPTAAAKEILNTTAADLTVKTPIGTVTVPQDALREAVSVARGTAITVEVIKVSKPTEIQKKAAGANGHIITVTIKSGNSIISTFGGKTLKLKAEVPSYLKGKNLVAIHIAADGTVEKLSGKLITEGSKEFYEFITSHLSTFALADADEIGLETEDPAAEGQAKLEKIKAGVKATTLVARSTKVKTASGKTAIKVTWIRSKGYKVDYYEVFRSTKKNSGYGTKAFYTTKDAKNPGTRTYYVNTKSLKKGTTYYYKVRGVRIVDGRKVYTQWSKKAIRTA